MPRFRAEPSGLISTTSSPTSRTPGRRTIADCIRSLEAAQGVLSDVRNALQQLSSEEPCGDHRCVEDRLGPRQTAQDPALGSPACPRPAPPAKVDCRRTPLLEQSPVQQDSPAPAPSTCLPQPVDTESVSLCGTDEDPAARPSFFGDEPPTTPMRTEVTQRFRKDHSKALLPALDQFMLERVSPEKGVDAHGRRFSAAFSMKPVQLDLLSWVRNQRTNAQGWVERQTGRQWRQQKKKQEEDDGTTVLHSLFLMKTCGGRLSLPILHPEAKNRIVWMCIGAFFIVYEACMLPYWIAFEVKPEGFLEIVNQVITAYFFVDIPSSMITGYRDSAGTLVMAPSRIVLRYLSTWFVPDFVATMPWDALSGSTASGTASSYKILFRVLRLFRMVRLFRLLKMEFLTDKVIMFIEANQASMFIASVLRVLFMLFALTHWGACIWYVLGSADNKVTWLENFKSKGYDVNTTDTGQLYIWSLYFTLTSMTTVGFGDIVPTNFEEVCFVLALLLIASLVFAGLMGTLTDLITSLNSRSHAKSEQKSMLSRYMRWRAVPQRLTSEIRQHFLFIWETNEGYENFEASLRAQLPPVLKTELCYHIYGQILRTAPFLSWLWGHSACVKQLAVHVQSIFLERDDYLFRRGQPNEQIYVLVSGKVLLTQNQRLEHVEPDYDHLGMPQGPAGYVIPRRKEAGLVDVGVGVIESAATAAQHVVWRGQRQDLAARVVGAFASKFKLNAADSEALFLDDHSDILARAEMRLRNDDARQAVAARLLQNFWRKVAHSKATHVQKSSSCRRGASMQLMEDPRKMRSRSVKAPAYFGESCLWTPMEEWSSAPLSYLYSVQCQARVEVAYIARSSIQQVINAFSPWLPKRFARFQRAVNEAFAVMPVARSCRNDSFVSSMQAVPATNVLEQSSSHFVHFSFDESDKAPSGRHAAAAAANERQRTLRSLKRTAQDGSVPSDGK